jgi:hypothetical protein
MVIYAFYEVIFSILTNGDKMEASIRWEEQNPVNTTPPSYEPVHGNGNHGGHAGGINGIQVNDVTAEHVVVASSPTSLVLPPRPSPVHSALLFLGCLGLSSFLLFGPGVLIAHWSGIEEFVSPSKDVWIILWVSLGNNNIPIYLYPTSFF